VSFSGRASPQDTDVSRCTPRTPLTKKTASTAGALRGRRPCSSPPRPRATLVQPPQRLATGSRWSFVRLRVQPRISALPHRPPCSSGTGATPMPSPARPDFVLCFVGVLVPVSCARSLVNHATRQPPLLQALSFRCVQSTSSGSVKPKVPPCDLVQDFKCSVSPSSSTSGAKPSCYVTCLHATHPGIKSCFLQISNIFNHLLFSYSLLLVSDLRC
jgi:hypothetical protein